MAAKTRKSRSNESEGLLNAQLVKALSHPLRLKLLTRFNEETASPNQLARELGETVELVSYHVRILRELGCIELVRTQPRRGATEHWYRAVVRPFFSRDEWESVPPSARSDVSAGTLRESFDDAHAALVSNVLDRRTDRHVSRTPLVLDEQGWRELNARLGELLDDARRIGSESAKRLKKGGGEGSIQSSLSLLHFELPDEAAREAAKKRRRPRARR